MMMQSYQLKLQSPGAIFMSVCMWYYIKISFLFNWTNADVFAMSCMPFSLPPMVSYDCLRTNSTTENRKESVIFVHTINLNQLNKTLASELGLENVPHTPYSPHFYVHFLSVSTRHTRATTWHL